MITYHIDKREESGEIVELDTQDTQRLQELESVDGQLVYLEFEIFKVAQSPIHVWYPAHQISVDGHEYIFRRVH